MSLNMANRGTERLLGVEKDGHVRLSWDRGTYQLGLLLFDNSD